MKPVSRRRTSPCLDSDLSDAILLPERTLDVCPHKIGWSFERGSFFIRPVILLPHQYIYNVSGNRLLIESFFILKFVPIWE